jgi:hypothetical protein
MMNGAETRRRLVLSVLLTIVMLITGCRGCRDGSGQFPETPAGPVAGTATVTSTDPENGDTGVAINKVIAAHFSEEMDPSSITTTTFLVTGPGGVAIAGVTSYAGFTAQFTPSSSLAVNATYSATITTGAQGLTGNALAESHTWSFATGASLDTTGPTVVSTDPASGDTGVAIKKLIAVTFSEGMAPLTINTTTFTITGPGATPVAGTITYLGLTAIFTPNSSLGANTVYTGTITTGAKDLSLPGNALAENYTWKFTTGSGLDTTPPTVTGTVIAKGATNVSVNTKFGVTFSETMDPRTITNLSFKVTGAGGVAVGGTVSYSGVTAVFIPKSALSPNTVYTERITTAVKDLAGNAMVSEFVLSFTTGASLDTTPPYVTATVHANGAKNVPINTKIGATFNEAMNPTTITNLTFKVTKTFGVPVTGTVTYSGVNAVFTPAANLPANTLLTATITTAAKDVAGNAMAANFVWSFTTLATADTTPPTVIATIPVNGAKNVSVNTKFGATFSEGMTPLTITNLTFLVTGPAGAVSGTVAYAGVNAVFTPDSALLGNTLYTGTITTGAKDLAGNPMAANFTWNFTTIAAADTIAPTVISTDPVNNTTGIAIDKEIAALFSEDMDSVTLTNVTFTVSGASGTVSYDALTKTAKFKPIAPLTTNTTYTATITTGAEDVAGNGLALPYVWQFSTVAAPTVISTDPASGAINVLVGAKVKATFSGVMNAGTIDNTTFTIAGVPGAVTYDALTRTATFQPTAELTESTLFTATIATGVKDLAGNPLAAPYTWTFTTGKKPIVVVLGAIEPFGSFGGTAGMTNQGTFTIVNGDIGTTGVSTKITGFHDSNGDVYTETPLNIGAVTGSIYTDAPPPGGAGVGGNATTKAIADAGALATQNAYNSIMPAALPGGIALGTDQLGGLTLAPGIYQAEGGSYQITGSDLTLDAQGDTNAVWVFQMASSLTVGGPGAPRTVNLINGAKAKNVFWQVGSSATINGAGGGTMEGTIIAYAGVTFSTAGNVALTRLNGRALSLTAAVTLVNTIITLPTP